MLRDGRTIEDTTLVVLVATQGHEHGLDDLARCGLWSWCRIHEPFFEFRAANKYMSRRLSTTAAPYQNPLMSPRRNQ